jgi:hypothetical protein
MGGYPGNPAAEGMAAARADATAVGKTQCLTAIVKQYYKNREHWSNHPCTPAEHLLIAAEELGEVARSMQERGDFYQWPPMYGPESYAELVDLGAVVLAMMLECPAE